MTGDIFIVCMGVVCYLVGFFFGKVFGARNSKVDRPEKCDTLEDILNREGYTTMERKRTASSLFS